MRHSYNPHCYSASSYDDDMCLKPTLLLWLAALFLSRAIMLPVSIGIGHIAGVNVDAMTLLRGFWSEEELLPALLAIPVLYSFCRRVPAASAPVRWIWAHGRVFLSLSAVLDISLPLVAQLWHREINDQLLLSLCTGALDVYFLAYILAARRVRDTLLDFPPPLSPASK